jgi:hypothetical protein
MAQLDMSNFLACLGRGHYAPSGMTVKVRASPFMTSSSLFVDGGWTAR